MKFENINIGSDTPIGELKNKIIEEAAEDEITILPAHLLGEIYIIGKRHKEAAEYFNSKIEQCLTKAQEIKLHIEVFEKFDTVVYNNQ